MALSLETLRADKSCVRLSLGKARCSTNGCCSYCGCLSTNMLRTSNYFPSCCGCHSFFFILSSGAYRLVLVDPLHPAGDRPRSGSRKLAQGKKNLFILRSSPSAERETSRGCPNVTKEETGPQDSMGSILQVGSTGLHSSSGVPGGRAEEHENGEEHSGLASW